MEGERIIFLDWLRVIACFMVVLVHSIEPFYLGGEGTLIANECAARWTVFLGSALRSAVPLFVMASSYLLVPLKTDTLTFFRGRAKRVVIPFIIWSLAYALIPYYGATDFDIKGNLCHLLLNFQGIGGHLWFVYMLLGGYLVMPILSPWLERVSKREEQIVLIVWLFTTLIPLFRKVACTLYGAEEVWGEASWNEFGMFYYLSGFFGYVVLGHYFRRWESDWSWAKTLVFAIPLLILGYAVNAFYFWSAMPHDYPFEGAIGVAVEMERMWDFCTFGVVLMTVGYFVLMRKISSAGWFYRRVILPISQVSYGLYLAHMFILVFFSAVFASTFAAYAPSTSVPLCIFCTAVSSYISAGVLTLMLSYVPYVGKWLTGYQSKLKL